MLYTNTLIRNNKKYIDIHLKVKCFWKTYQKTIKTEQCINLKINNLNTTNIVLDSRIKITLIYNFFF